MQHARIGRVRSGYGKAVALRDDRWLRPSRSTADLLGQPRVLGVCRGHVERADLPSRVMTARSAVSARGPRGLAGTSLVSAPCRRGNIQSPSHDFDGILSR